MTAALDHYTMLDSALIPHRVRMKNASGELVTLDPVSRNELTDSELSATGSPSKYYKMGGAIFPVPIPNYGADDGVELEFQRGANHFTIASTDAEPGFNPQFHSFLSVGASLRYAMANGMSEKTGMLITEKERIRKSMIEHYQTRSKDERPTLTLKKRSIHSYGL